VVKPHGHLRHLVQQGAVFESELRSHFVTMAQFPDWQVLTRTFGDLKLESHRRQKEEERGA
jgi:hypothetical protein